MSTELNWSKLHAGRIEKWEIERYVRDGYWQKTRKVMKGTSLHTKYTILEHYLISMGNMRPARVQVTNYINALSRSGVIPPVKIPPYDH